MQNTNIFHHNQIQFLSHYTQIQTLTLPLLFQDKMGINTFALQTKIKIPASRFFKAMVVDSTDIVPKFTPRIKNIELLQGESFTPGCVIQTHFVDGKSIYRGLSCPISLEIID